jgi:hypothetical protein
LPITTIILGSSTKPVKEVIISSKNNKLDYPQKIEIGNHTLINNVTNFQLDTVTIDASQFTVNDTNVEELEYRIDSQKPDKTTLKNSSNRLTISSVDKTTNKLTPLVVIQNVTNIIASATYKNTFVFNNSTPLEGYIDLTKSTCQNSLNYTLPQEHRQENLLKPTDSLPSP